MTHAKIVNSEVTVMATALGVDENKLELEIIESIARYTFRSSSSVIAGLKDGMPIPPAVRSNFLRRYGWNMVDPRNSPFNTAGHKAVFDTTCLPDHCLIQTSSGIAALRYGGLVATENSAFECQNFQMYGYWVPSGADETSLDYWVRRMTQLVTERA